MKAYRLHVPGEFMALFADQRDAEEGYKEIAESYAGEVGKVFLTEEDISESSQEFAAINWASCREQHLGPFEEIEQREFCGRCGRWRDEKPTPEKDSVWQQMMLR